MRSGISFFVILSLMGFLAIFPLTFGSYWTNIVFQENGPVEIASALLWLIASIIVLLNSNINTKFRALFSLAFILFALREYDFQGRFTKESFIKINYYEDISSLSDYLLAFLAIFLITIIAVALIVSILNFWRNYLPSVPAFLILSAWSLLVFSKILDRAPAKLQNDLDIHLEEIVTQTFMSLEEGLELLAPVIMITAFWTAPLLHTNRLKGRS